jgi:PAS domain S-box-containing protein
MTDIAETTPCGAACQDPPRAVVALGASAGGLEAVREFFSHTPLDSGLSFIVVHHRDSPQPKLVAELLAAHTSLPVHEARDGVQLRPNSVYVVPPNASLGLEQGRLRSTPTPSGSSHAISAFFGALAEDQGPGAVAIVLSGVYGEGALGLEAVKAHGGLTLAQSSESAGCDPAVMTGLVDHVLPPHAMPEKLIAYAARLRSKPPSAQAAPEVALRLERLERDLRSSQQQLATVNQELESLNGDLDNLLRSTQIAALFLDSELRVRRYTPSLTDVVHITDSDLGRPITDLAARFETGLLAQDAREVLRTLTDKTRELSLSSGGAYVMRTTPYRTLDNVIDGVVVDFSDVATLEQAEDYRARLAAIIEDASEAVIGKTLDGTIVSWNRAAEAIYAYTAEEIIGKSIYTLIPPDRATELEAIIARLRAGQHVPRFETERVRKDGMRVLVSLTISPIRNSAGQVIGASAIARDVTRERQAEKSVRASEERYRSLVAATSAVVWTTDANGAFADEQPSWQRFTGQTPQQYRDRGWLQALHPEDRSRVRDAWRLALLECSTFEIGFRVFSATHRDYRRVAARAVPVLDENGRAREWIGTLSDVTAEREAVEALRARANELRAVIDGSTAGIIEADAAGRILRANRQISEMTRYAPQELVGMRVTELSHPDDRQKNSAFLQKAIAQRLPGYSGERRMMKKNGEVYFAQLSTSILRDASGAPTRVIAVLQDMTERKLAETELARAKTAAERASRAKDQFLAVLSHELRTPLTPVLAAVTKLEKTESSLSPDGRQTLRMIQRNVELEARLIDDLLDLTRISRGRLSLRFEVADASSVMAQALEIVSNEVEEKSLRLETAIEAGCHVRADTARLQQVFWNLLKNAVKFTPAGGLIRVCCQHELDGRVLAEVSDTGIGIDRGLLPHVFDAFEQAEPRREGLGLGLAISRALVQLHGGEITAESRGSGRGASFRVLLPSTSELEPSSPSRRPETPLEPQRQGLAVLLVEDHADSALLMRELLELSGHEVAQAATLSEAMTAAAGRVFDLLLSDLGLPDGSGLELVRALRESGRVRHAIALSGYGMEDDIRRSREAGFEEHLVKPVNPRELEATIRRVTQVSRAET